MSMLVQKIGGLGHTNESRDGIEKVGKENRNDRRQQAQLKAPSTSSLRKTLLKSGRLNGRAGVPTNPRDHAMMVTMTIAARKAKGFFREIRKTETATPTIVSRAGLPNAPSLTKVTGSETMEPAFRKPMKVRKMPMPAAAAILISLGRSEERRVGKECR